MKRIILILLLITVEAFAQAGVFGQDSTATGDSSKVLIHSPLTLQNLNTLEIRQSFFTDFSAFPELALMQTELESEPTQLSTKLLQANLLANFKQSMQWKSDYSLGVFGQVLGAAMSAAAVGLGVYSVAKYGKDYFNNKKRRK